MLYPCWWGWRKRWRGHRRNRATTSLRFSQQTPVHTSPQPIRATCPSHLILLGFVTRTLTSNIINKTLRRFCSGKLHFTKTKYWSVIYGKQNFIIGDVQWNYPARNMQKKKKLRESISAFVYYQNHTYQFLHKGNVYLIPKHWSRNSEYYTALL
jgi:hypothetical protein